MKTIIAGSRTVKDYQDVVDAVEQSGYDITEIISGGAIGADCLGEHYAVANRIKLTVFKAKWQDYGKKAGYLRNEEMAEYGDALIALWDGKSKGTKNMIDIAYRKGLKVWVHLV